MPIQDRGPVGTGTGQSTGKPGTGAESDAGPQVLALTAPTSEHPEELSPGLVVHHSVVSHSRGDRFTRMFLQVVRSLPLGDTGLTPACRWLDRRGGAWDRLAGMPDNPTLTVARMCAPHTVPGKDPVRTLRAHDHRLRSRPVRRPDTVSGPDPGQGRRLAFQARTCSGLFGSDAVEPRSDAARAWRRERRKPE